MFKYTFNRLYKYSQLDQSLKTFLHKYKTTEQQQPILPPSKPLQTAQAQSHPLPESVRQQQTTDKLKQKYLLSKATKIELNDKQFFQHYNRPQQMELDRQLKVEQKQYEQEEKMNDEREQGEQLFDNVKLPDEWMQQAHSARLKGMKDLENTVDRLYNPDGYNSSDVEEYNDLAEWKEYNKITAPIINRMRIENVKPYPGTDKGQTPEEDPEGFTQWFVDNHSPELVQSYSEAVELLAPEFEDLNQKQDDQPSDQEDQPYELVTAGPGVFLPSTLVECLVQGNPMEDLAQFGEVRIRSRLDPDEIEPLPAKFPLIYEEAATYIDRWSLFRMYPHLVELKDIKSDNTKQQRVPFGSLNTYYQTLPKLCREDPGVKNVFRGLEWYCPQLSMMDKEKALNMAARLAMPLDELAADINKDVVETYRPQPTRYDEERLIYDQESEIVDPVFTPQETDKYLDIKAKHVPGGQGDWPIPDYVINKVEKVDDLPIDYYINEDGFWDEYIKEKEQRHLQDSRLAGSKQFLNHQ